MGTSIQEWVKCQVQKLSVKALCPHVSVRAFYLNLYGETLMKATLNQVMGQMGLGKILYGKPFALVESLLRNEFVVDAHDPIPYGYRIRLDCGLVITMYTSGRTMVQGSTGMSYPQGYLQALIPLLPIETSWNIKEVRYPAVAKFLREHRAGSQTAKRDNRSEC
jgi:hypothetical protein